MLNGNFAEKTISQYFNINKATAKPVVYKTKSSDNYNGSGDFKLVNGIRGSVNHHDGEWQGWAGSDAELVIDLQQTAEIKSISVGSLQNAGAYIFFPAKLEFFVSADGQKFEKVAEAVNDIDPLSGEKQLKDFSVSIATTTASYVKIILKNLGKCPKGHAGEGQSAWMFIDEVIIE